MQETEPQNTFKGTPTKQPIIYNLEDSHTQLEETQGNDRGTITEALGGNYDVAVKTSSNRGGSIRSSLTTRTEPKGICDKKCNIF